MDTRETRERHRTTRLYRLSVPCEIDGTRRVQMGADRRRCDENAKLWQVVDKNGV